MLTRLGGSGTDVFPIMKVAGPCSVVVSQKYVHPSSESLCRAIERLDAMNGGLTETPSDGPKRQLPATVGATRLTQFCKSFSINPEVHAGWCPSGTSNPVDPA